METKPKRNLPLLAVELIALLESEGPMTAADLARRTGIGKPRATECLRLCRDDGLASPTSQGGYPVLWHLPKQAERAQSMVLLHRKLAKDRRKQLARERYNNLPADEKAKLLAKKRNRADEIADAGIEDHLPFTHRVIPAQAAPKIDIRRAPASIFHVAHILGVAQA